MKLYDKPSVQLEGKKGIYLSFYG